MSLAGLADFAPAPPMRPAMSRAGRLADRRDGPAVALPMISEGERRMGRAGRVSPPAACRNSPRRTASTCSSNVVATISSASACAGFFSGCGCRADSIRTRSRLNTLARLDRATDLQGSEAAGVVMGLQSVLGTDFATAADRAATLANAGFDARTIQRITEQGGVLEGEDLFSLFMAARQENIDPNTVGEGFLTLRNALSRTDAEGRVAPALRAIGLEPGQPFVEQLRLLRTAQRQGRVDYGQIGGTRAQSTAEFFFRALDRLPAARADFTGGTIDQELARRNQSAYIQAMERQLMRELRVKLAEERSGMGGFGEAYAEGQTTFQEIAGGDYTGSTALGVLRSMWNPHAAYRADARRLYYQGRRSPMLRPEAAARAVGVPLEEYLENTDGDGVTYNDYRTQYNNARDPMITPSDR